MSRMVGIGGGDWRGRSRSGVHGLGPAFRGLDAAFDFADGVQVFGNFGAVGGTEILFQTVNSSPTKSRRLARCLRLASRSACVPRQKAFQRRCGDGLRPGAGSSGTPG